MGRVIAGTGKSVAKGNLMTIATLRTRRDLSRSLRELSQRQTEALSLRDYDALIQVVSEKRSVIDRISTLTPAAREWLDGRHTLSAGEREAGEALMAEANQLLADIGSLESSAIEELARQRDETRRELLEINSAGRVHSAYRDSLAPITRRSLDVDR